MQQAIRLSRILEQTVRQAGEIALRYFENAANSVQKKQDGTEVSEADLKVNDHLYRHLPQQNLDIGWLSEETIDDGARHGFNRLWVVDPIDGTRGFLQGSDQWTISVALIENQRPVLSSVYNPIRDEFYMAERNQGANLNGQKLHITDGGFPDHVTILSSKGHIKRLFDGTIPEQLNNRWVYSLAYRLALVGAGKVDATLSLSPKSDWDIAAADLIVSEAGGVLSNHLNEKFLYNGPTTRHKSIVAAGPKRHKKILKQIQDKTPPLDN